MTLTIGSLFSGYLGLDLALHDVFPDAETAFVSDIDPGACKVLAHRAPDAPNLGDVSTVDWTPWARQIFALSAGFPCQDVSAAGKRAGLKKGTRTGLWHETARAIRELQPQLVLLENVRGLLSARGDEPTADHLAAEATALAAKHLTDWIDRRHAIAVRQGRTDHARDLAARRLRAMGCRKRALDRARRHERRLVRAIGTVLGSLADLGYDAAWCGLRAADVGAPHGRWRVFILAWPSADTDHAAEHGERARSQSRQGGSALADAERRGFFGRASEPGRRSVGGAAAQGAGSLLPTPAAYDGDRGGAQHPDKRKAGGHSVTLQDAVSGLLSPAVALLGTPTARDHKGSGPVGSDSHAWLLEHGNVEAQVLGLPSQSGEHLADDDLAGGVLPLINLDESAEVGDGFGAEGDGHGETLAPEIQADLAPQSKDFALLPTPAVNDMGAAYTPDEWDAWTDRMKAEHGNGNGHGASLSIEALRLLPTPTTEPNTGNGHARNLGAEAKLLPTPRVKNNENRQSDGYGGKDGNFHGLVTGQTDWGKYAPAIRRWEAMTRPSPEPTELGPKGNPRLSCHFDEWLMGLEHGWITDVPGVTHNEALKLCGNGVVWQQGAAALRWLLAVRAAALRTKEVA